MKALVPIFAAAVVVILACADSPVITCPSILYVKKTIPDTTTIKVGAATIAIAGAAYGGCETGPPPPDFVWVADSTVVSVAPIDSIHARIQGLRPGKTTVTPTYRTAHDEPSAVTVTVVP